MNKDFDTELIGMNEKIKGGYAYIISNLSKIIAFVTAIVTAILVFTDIAFLGINSRELTTSLILIMISSYVMYFSLEESGERLYEDSEEYGDLVKKYSSISERVTLDMLPALRAFCEKYSADELTYRKRRMMLYAGLTEDELKKETPITDRKKARAKRRIARAKPLSLTPELLLSNNSTEAERLRDPGRDKLINLTLKILPTTVCAFFTASVVLSVKELTPVTVIEGIMKLSTLPIVGFRGYVNGYNYKKDNESAWLKNKIRILEGFLAEYSEKSAS